MKLATNDIKIPNETVIYYSKSNSIFTFVIMLGFLFSGIVLLLLHQYLGGAILSILGGWTTFLSYKKIKNDKPQIIINYRGITTSPSGFKKWKEIHNLYVGYINKVAYLKYDYTGGSEKLTIRDLKITMFELEYLIKVYQNA